MNSCADDSDYEVKQDHLPSSSSSSSFSDVNDREHFTSRGHRKKYDKALQKKKQRILVPRKVQSGSYSIHMKWTDEISSAQVLRICNMNRQQIVDSLEDGFFLSLLQIPPDDSTPKVVILRMSHSQQGYFLVTSELLQSIYETCDSNSLLYLVNGKLKFSRSHLFMEGLILAKMAHKFNSYMSPKQHVSMLLEDGCGRPNFPNGVVLDMGELVTKPTTKNRLLMMPVDPIFHSDFTNWMPPVDGQYNSHYFDLYHIETNAVAMVSVLCASKLKNILVRIDTSWAEPPLENGVKKHSQVFVMVKKKDCVAQLYSVPEMLSRCVCDLDYQYLESNDLTSFLCRIGVESGDKVTVSVGKLSLTVNQTVHNNCFITPAYYKLPSNNKRKPIQNGSTETNITDFHELYSLPSTGLESMPSTRSCSPGHNYEIDAPALSLPCYSLTSEPRERYRPCKVVLDLRPVVLLDIPENFAHPPEEPPKSTEVPYSACMWCGPEYLERYHLPSFNLLKTVSWIDFGLHRRYRHDLTDCFCDFAHSLEAPPVRNVRHCREQHSKLLLRGYVKCGFCSRYFGSYDMLAGHQQYHERGRRLKLAGRGDGQRFWEYGRSQLRKDIETFFGDNVFTSDLIISSCEDWVLTEVSSEVGVNLSFGRTSLERSAIPKNSAVITTDSGQVLPRTDNDEARSNEPHQFITYPGNDAENRSNDPSFLNPYLERTAVEFEIPEAEVEELLCSICGRQPQDQDHAKELHGNLVLPCRWKCRKCERQFAAVNGFMVHHPCVGEPLKCCVCPLKTVKYYFLAIHYAASHDGFMSCSNHVGKRDPDPTNFHCKFCPRRYSSPAELQEHSVVHEVSLSGRPPKNGNYPCGFCRVFFATEKARAFHELFHDRLDCPSCEDRFGDLDSLLNHLPNCHVLPTSPDLHQRCCFCGNSKRGGFLTQTPLKRGCECKHVLTKQCTFCCKKFKFQTNVAKHLYEVHREVRKTYCQKCDIWFPTRYMLMLHRKSKCLRAGKLQYGCTCGANFRRKSYLKSHQHKKRALLHLKKKQTATLKKGISEKQTNQDSQRVSTCSKCYKQFPRRHQLRLHMRLSHKTTDTNCSVCRLTFHSAKTKKNHDRVYHGQLLFRCHVCQIRVRSRIGLQRHMTDMHYQYYKCIVCQVSFEFPHLYEQHMRLHEKQCEKCFCLHENDEDCEKGKVRRAIELHATPYEKWKRPLSGTKFIFECIVCMQTFRGQAYLSAYESHWNQHVMEVSTITECPQCCYTTVEGFADIRQHMIEFHPKKFHQCGNCLLHFTHAATLDFHRKYCYLTSTQVKSFIELSKAETFCEDCGVLFRDREDLAKHEAEVHQHLKQGPYHCRRCDIGFSHKWKYTSHRNIRHRYYVCQPCPFMSVYRHGMLNHLRFFHKLDPTVTIFQCEDCPFKAERRVPFEKHLIRKHKHKLEKDCSFLKICEKCGKEFHANEIFNHMASHLKPDDRKFVCEVCSARFKMKHHLINHMNTHQDKKFNCEKCNIKFTLRHHLRAHERSFHGRSGYRCRDCGMEFKLRWKRTKHRQTEHDATGITDDEDLGRGNLGISRPRKRKRTVND